MKLNSRVQLLLDDTPDTIICFASANVKLAKFCSFLFNPNFNNLLMGLLAAQLSS